LTYVNRNARRLMLPLGFILLLLTGLSMSWGIAEAYSPTLTPQSSTGRVGDLVSIPIVLSEAPDGVSGFDIVVSLSNANVASIVSAEFPDFGLTQYTQISDSQVRLKAVDFAGVIESGATNVTLATLTLQGLKKGSTDIQISVNILDDDFGYPITVTPVDGTFSVKKAPGSGGGKGNDNGKGGGRGKK